MSHPNDAASDPALPIPSPEAARQVVPHSGLNDARHQAMAALDAGARTIAVIGAAGTGKTLLMGELADLLRARQATVHLLRTTHDLLTFRLAQGDAPDPSAAVLLDEADRAGDAELASVLGRGKAAGQEGGLRILAGLPPLLRRLDALGRPAVAVTLNPVPREELSGFIAARLGASGYAPDFFTPEAVEELATRSGGVPRLVNVLTAAAAFAASLDHAPEVTARHVVEATRHAAGSAHVVRPASDPQIFAERPAPQPRAPGEPPPADRPHLVDAVARWAGASWLAPGERHPGLTPPDENPQATPAGEDPLPPGPARPRAQAEALDEVEPLAPAILPNPETPADPAQPDAAERSAVESGPAPASLPADELVIPPQPAPVLPVTVPEPAMPAPLPPAEPVAEAIPPAREPAEPGIPTPIPTPVAAKTAARPALAEPAAEPAPDAAPRRRHGWTYAVAALLVLGGAGFALDRSRDAPAGSPLARLSPLRAWIEERTGLAPANRPADTAAVSPPASTALPAPAAAVPDRPVAGPTAPAAGTAAPSISPRTDEARPPAAVTGTGSTVTPPAPAETARTDDSPAGRLPAPSALAPPSQESRQAEAPAPSPPPPSVLQPSASRPSESQEAVGRAPGSTAPPSQTAPSAPAAAPPPENPAPPVVAAAPPANPPRVMIHVLSRQARGGEGERALAELAERYPGASTLRGGRGPSFPVVRHFFPADAQSAEAIAALLSARGITARVQDFSAFRPQPRPGTVEVWLP